MNAESQSNTQIFLQKESAQARMILAVIFVVLPLLLGRFLWQSTENEIPIIRWGTRLFVLFAAIGTLNKWAMPILSPTPTTLRITDEDIMVSNWLNALRWSDIGLVKVLNKKAERTATENGTVFYPRRVVLVFYSKREPGKAMREVIGFNRFENGDELIAALNKRLEQPVIKEGIE